MWLTADAVHIDLRDLEPPELLQTKSIPPSLPTSIAIFLYPELDDRGWSHELLPSSCGSADCEDGS